MWHYAIRTMADADFCQQRSIKQRTNNPLSRFSLDSINPYLTKQFTKQQLDMRRKVEILKYSANKSSAQTNNLTKREKFALLVRGGFGNTAGLNIGKRGNANCTEDATAPTPTSSCNVPGPVIYLQADESVPLYNYSGFNIRTYPNYVPDNATPWQFVVNPDVPIDNDPTASNPAYYLIINNVINYPQHSFNVVAPIEITFSGTVPVTTTQPTYLYAPVNIKILSAKLNAYYNSNFSNSVEIVDNSVSNLIDGPTLPEVAFNVLPNYVGTFISTQFFGTLEFNGLTLYTAPTYVYGFKLDLTIGVSSGGDIYANNFRNYTNFRFDIVGNPAEYRNLVRGCNVSIATGTFNKPSSISGVAI
jgi:hypothetical protein